MCCCFFLSSLSVRSQLNLVVSIVFSNILIIHSLFLLSCLVSLCILSNDVRGKGLVRLETSTVNVLEFLVVLSPLIFHLPLEVLTDLKIGMISFGIVLKCLFNKNLVNILKMQFICPTLIRLDLVIL